MDIRTILKDIAYPRQVVLVTSEADVEIFGKRQDKKDIITLSWHTPLSFEPFLYGIAVGKARFSKKLIEKSKVFAVNFMPAEFEKQILFCGKNSDELIDKFKETGLTPVECSKIHCSRIREALAWLECEVVEEVDMGDHVLVVGRVLNSSAAGKGRRLFQSGDGFTTTIDV